MDWIIEIMARVVLIRIPPLIDILMEVASVYMTAPNRSMRGGMDAKGFRSSTSEFRPTGGDKTDCIKCRPSFM